MRFANLVLRHCALFALVFVPKALATETMTIQSGHYLWHEWSGVYQESFPSWHKFRDQVSRLNGMKVGERAFKTLKIGSVLKLPPLPKGAEVAYGYREPTNVEATKPGYQKEPVIAKNNGCEDVASIKMKNESLQKENAALLAAYNQTKEIVDRSHERMVVIENRVLEEMRQNQTLAAENRKLREELEKAKE